MKKFVSMLVLLSVLLFTLVLPVLAQSPTPAVPATPQVSTPIFSMDWGSLWLILQAAGLPGLVIGVVILVFVFIGEFTDIFPTGLFKRLAVIIGSTLFSGVFVQATVVNALTAALAILLSTLGKMAVDALVALAAQQKAARAVKA